MFIGIQACQKWPTQTEPVSSSSSLLAKASMSAPKPGAVKEESVQLAPNPYLQQLDDICSKEITEAAPLTLSELKAALKPLWKETSKTVRIRKIGSQHRSRIMTIEFEQSVSVKDHIERLVKSQKRVDLIEGLVLLKQLKYNSLNRPDFSSTGCIPAWYQQISGDS
jgi:hypothetical protein